MKYKFVIVSMRQNCGGPIALHALCKYLSDLGYDSKIFYTGNFVYKKENKCRFWLSWLKYTIIDFIKIIIVKLNKGAIKKKPLRYAGYGYKPVNGCKRKFTPFVDKNTIVVYPEITYGNFLKAKNVVRWLLYYNKLYNEDNPDSYDKGDLFFCYREVFNDAILNPDLNKLQTPFYNLNLYKQTNFGKREGKCYIIRKGKNRSDLPKHFDGIVIDNLSEYEIVDVFNKCEICVSYDTQTAYSKIASICGCLSIVIPEPDKTKEDYLAADDFSYGVAWGWSKEEIEYAQNTKSELVDMYKQLNSDGVEMTKKFIEKSIGYFDVKG